MDPLLHHAELVLEKAQREVAQASDRGDAEQRFRSLLEIVERRREWEPPAGRGSRACEGGPRARESGRRPRPGSPEAASVPLPTQASMSTFTSFGLPVPPDGQRLTYGGYLRIRELTGLQRLLSDPPQHDETLFIIIHQTYELWFKQLLHEVDAIVERLRTDQVLNAQRLLQRCIEIGRVLVAQVAVLETMTPVDFLAFRNHLTPASGFQSAQFRELEFASGLKEPRFLQYYEEGSPERAALERRLAAPSVGDAFYDLLRRRGFDLPADPEGVEAPAETEEHRRRMEGLLRIYREAETHYTLFLLAEALIEYDETFRLWRLRHVTMVERMIGDKPGTGGSSGADYLRRSAERKFFPDLWELRSYLG